MNRSSVSDKRTAGAEAETRFLESIPGMVESLREASSEPIESCQPYDPEEEW